MKQLSHLEKMSLENMIIEHGIAPVLNHMGAFLRERAEALLVHQPSQSRNSITYRALERASRLLDGMGDNYDGNNEYQAAEEIGMERAKDDARLKREAE